MSNVSSLTDVGAVRDYLNRVGAEARSLKTAVVRETRGNYWTDVATIRFSASGDIDCSSLAHAPTEFEMAAIKAEWATVVWPKPKRLARLRAVPAMMAEAQPKDVFEFRTADGSEIIMVQVRVQREGGEKSYVPWTYWDDGKWRMCEPDGDLPLWGLEQLAHHGTVFIHEGAKAAAHAAWMVGGGTREAREALERHPWGREMQGAAHVGWIGGALNPNRTDWSPIVRAGIDRAYIIADNDEPGKAAIARIAQKLPIKTFSVEFNDRFPRSFDLADDFPIDFFKQIGRDDFYVGPSMRTLTSPATWATDLMPNPAGKGRPITVLRDAFKHMWAYVEEADAYVCTEMPEIMRSETVFNKICAGFSHANETAKLLNKAYKGRSSRVCYRPDQEGRLVDYRGTNAINLHVPSTIRSVAGDPRPFLEFLEYLFPLDGERKDAMKWIATLIARPSVRMSYGLLLVSETQGVGKTTLGASILAPLVGEPNVSYPSETDITSDFNGWVGNKRLAIVNEIYSGSSWRAYHALKSVITDHDVTVNEKYMRAYTTDNWCHVLACSNSMRALKMENDDRRWFYPEVTEVPWPGEKSVELRRGLQGSGLAIVKSWAEGYGNYVGPSDRAPMTERKRELIEGSRSDAQREAAALAEVMCGRDEPIGVLIKEVMGWVRSSVHGKVFDSDYELRRAMVESGARVWPKRYKIRGRLQYVVVNGALWDVATRSEDPSKTIREAARKPEEIMEAEI